MNEDLEQLNLLSIFHYVVAGVSALLFCFPLFHLVFGIAMLSGWGDFSGRDPGMQFAGCFMVAFAVIFITFGWGYAACLAVAGSYLKQHTRYTFCLVMAAVSCLFAPLGTVLGVFTLMVLMRPGVRELFGQPVTRPVPPVPAPPVPDQYPAP